MKTTEKLPQGSYMKVTDVLDFCYKNGHSSAAWMIRSKISSICVDVVGYYKVDQLKDVLTEEFFKEIECSVTTEMVL
jgi:hypothetical protein